MTTIYAKTQKLGSKVNFHHIPAILTCDLTRYHPALKENTECVIVACRGNLGDQFARVAFGAAGAWDILWAGLKITCSAYLAWHEALESEKAKKIAGATEAVLHLGPNGGLRHIEFTWRVGRKRGIERFYDWPNVEAVRESLKAKGKAPREEREPRRRQLVA